MGFANSKFKNGFAAIFFTAGFVTGLCRQFATAPFVKMNVAITFEKPGYRIKRRRIQNKNVPNKHQVTKEETMEFMKQEFQVNIE